MSTFRPLGDQASALTHFRLSALASASFYQLAIRLEAEHARIDCSEENRSSKCQNRGLLYTFARTPEAHPAPSAGVRCAVRVPEHVVTSKRPLPAQMPPVRAAPIFHSRSRRNTRRSRRASHANPRGVGNPRPSLLLHKYFRSSELWRPHAHSNMITESLRAKRNEDDWQSASRSFTGGMR